MLRLSGDLENRDVLSLRVGQEIGCATMPIINPNNLKIEGWHAEERGTKEYRVLPSTHIREILPKGFVVDDHESLTHPEDLVRMQDILQLQFELKGKSVKTDAGRKLGKVTDYVLDDQSMIIQKLHITPPGLKSLTKSDLIIGRNQIVEINNKEIIVKDVTVRSGQPAVATA